MAKKSMDNIGGKCLRDDEGKLVTGLKKQLKKYMEKLRNEENEWNGCIEGPIQSISYKEVEKAFRKMRPRMAAGHGLRTQQIYGILAKNICYF